MIPCMQHFGKVKTIQRKKIKTQNSHCQGLKMGGGVSTTQGCPLYTSFYHKTEITATSGINNLTR